MVNFASAFMSHEPQHESLSENGEQRPRKRSAPWLLGGLVLLLLSVLVVLQVFGLWEVFTPDTASDTLLLYALSSLNFVAFFVFTFIFIRNLVKLRRERRARQLGSKIKTRLIVYFITVSLLPITAMAVFSYIFFNRSLDKWFSSLPEEVFREATGVQRGEQSREMESLREIAATLAVAVESQTNVESEASEVVEQDSGAPLAPLVASARLAMLAIVSPDGTTEAASGGDLSSAQRATLLAAVERTARTGAGSGETQIGDVLFDIVVQPIGGGRAQQLAVARVRRADPSLGRLVAGARTFDDFKRRQRKVRLLGLSTLGLLTLMLLFAATWSAIHLARGIATPIRALAEASDEVARGNLDHRVTAMADDELALLADSFNQMTAQLAENRRRIEAGAEELRVKNLALAERRDYIETVLESLSTGVVSLDARDRVTTINAAALVMLRLEAAPAPGTSLEALLIAEDQESLGRVLRRARLRGRAAEQVELARTASFDDGDNTAIPVALTATALGTHSDGGRGVVLVMEDLSELLAAQRAAAWGEVAQRMAHEIKNPLTPIQLSAERIARNFHRRDGADQNGASASGVNEGSNGRSASDRNGDDDAGERERVARVVDECTTTITREVAGLKAMVDEFTRFARLPHPQLEHADLNKVVAEAVTLYEDRLGDARLDVRLAHTLPAGLLDAEQLRRVFVNLIDNAIEALAGTTEGERRITVATAHDPARALLLAEVVDNGHGIAPADFPRLFQPHFSTRGRGTGLGLAIIQRIVKEHGGRIRAETNRPRGAKFTVELPVAEETRR